MNESTPTQIRDSYGFIVNPAYHTLQNKFASLWAEEEAERVERWDRWLQSLGKIVYSKTQDSDDDHTEEILELVLEQYTSGSPSQAPQLTALMQQLRSLVQMGVPMNRRAQFWKAFLNIKSKQKPGLYNTLVQEALESSNTAAILDTTPESTNKPSGGASRRYSAADIITTDSKSSRTCSNHSSTSACSSIPEAYATNITSIDVPFSPASSCDTPSSSVSSVLPTQKSAPPDFGSWGERDWISQIDKDLHRTFPGHPLMDIKGRDMLRRILAAYSVRNPTVGYCQGLNFLAAAFMLLCPEEDAFWCLAAVVEDILPGYFDSHMVSPQVDALVLSHLLKSSVPSVSAHLEELEVDAASVASSWFLVAFLNSLPIESSLRVWDVLFFERSPVVLFRVALALIDIYSQPLLETEESSDAYMLLQAMGPMSFDSSRLIDTACIGYWNIKDSALQVLRDKYRPQVLNQMRLTSISSDDEDVYTELTSHPPAQPWSRSQRFADAASSLAADAAGIASLYTSSLARVAQPPEQQQPPLPPKKKSSVDIGSLEIKPHTKSVAFANLPKNTDESILSSVPSRAAITTRQRRTRSAQVLGTTGRHSLGRSSNPIDLHRLAAFVPDFRQPAVAAAYKIAANPQNKKNGPDTQQHKTPLQLVYSLGRPTATNDESLESAVYERDDAIKTLDFGDLSRNPSDDDASHMMLSVPRRFTDGGALFKTPHQKPCTSSSSDLLQLNTANMTKTPSILVPTELLDQIDSTTTAQQQLGVSPSGTLLERMAQLRLLYTRLQIQVEEAESKRAETELKLHEAQDLRDVLQQQLIKVNSDVADKMGVLETLRGKLVDLQATLKASVQEYSERRDVIEQLRSSVDADRVVVKERQLLLQALMTAAAEFSKESASLGAAGSLK